MPPPPRATSQRKKTGSQTSPLRTVQEAVQSRQFDPVYHLYGDDDYLKESAVSDLLAAAVDPATRDFNLELRRAGELDAETLGSLLNTPPMLAERRAVVLRDVAALKKAARSELDRYLANPASDTLLLLVALAGSKVDNALVDAATPLLFEPLPPERVRRWIKFHTQTVLRADVSEEAAALLQQAVGDDLQMLAAELDKCLSHLLGASQVNPSSETDTAAPVIDEETIAAVVGVRRGETVADLLDAVAGRDAARAAGLIAHVLSQPKVSAVQVVMMLSTQAFALAWGRARRDSGVPRNRLAQEFFAFLKETGGYPGRPWGEAASAWTKSVDRWAREDSERALALLLDADMALKDTRVSNDEQIITSLVLSLCAVRATRRRVA